MKFLENREQITPAFIKKYISSHIPVEDSSANVLDVGCDNFAVDFGDIIVRLPSDDEALQALKFESTVCRHINVPSLQTPKTKVIDAEYPFSWHRKIPGGYFLTKDYESLNSAQKDKIAGQIAEFLMVFHPLSMDKMRSVGGDNLPDYVSLSHMRDNAQIIPDDLKNHFEHFMQAYEKLSVPEADRVFGYFDAHGWNMAFNQETGELVGIYDFADAGFGDVHQDFHPLNTIAQDLVKDVIRKYEELSSRTIDISKVNFYTVLAEYSDLFETAQGQQTLMQKGLEHHIQQIKRWENDIKF